ncbi:MAG: phosphoglycerate dehydrogenase [Candidatus Nanopelagicales bacterium]|nr:phosphoglycerate dehydrogenase [Candidatus Nanopelagicales bacterium]
MARVLITTVPFGAHNNLPLELLASTDAGYSVNPLGRRLKEAELAQMAVDTEIIIAGTEPITATVMDAATNLKLISRVGIGLDNVDLHAARERGIAVSYTPEAPAPAVAELTIGLILSLLRHTHLANLKMHRGEWDRHMGRRISEVTIGIIGTGRIGSRVLRRIPVFGTPRTLVNDLNPEHKLVPESKLEWVSKDTIYREADVISVHVPFTKQTRNMIGLQQLRQMKPDALIINTSRGGIINESDLYQVLSEGHLGGAAIDVFQDEPYVGPLGEIDRCLLTCHMGSMSIDCRSRMEIEATEEVVRFLRGLDLQNLVPEDEYLSQQLFRG